MVKLVLFLTVLGTILAIIGTNDHPISIFLGVVILLVALILEANSGSKEN